MTRPTSATHLRRAPRWILGVLTTLVVCAMLAVNGLATAEIVSETGAGETGDASAVPASIAEGGPVIDATGDSTVSTTLPAKTVSLTFDDGPDPEWTPQILAVLNHTASTAPSSRSARTSSRYPEIVRQIVARGLRGGAAHVHPRRPDHGVGAAARPGARRSRSWRWPAPPA